MTAKRDLKELKTADLDFLWDSLNAEMQNLHSSIEGLEEIEPGKDNGTLRVMEDLKNLGEINDIILGRSLAQRTEFYTDLRREQRAAIETENYEHADRIKRELAYFKHAFLQGTDRKPQNKA